MFERYQGCGFIARALAGANSGVVRFDFTSLGGSGGDFSNTRFSSNVEDLVADLRVVATVGAPCDPCTVAKRFRPELALTEAQGQAMVKRAAREFTIERGFTNHISGQRAAWHAPRDAMVTRAAS